MGIQEDFTAPTSRRLIPSLALFLSLLGLIGCSGRPNLPLETPAAAPDRAAGSETFVYRCPDDYRFVARLEGEKAWLFLPGETVALARTPSASGAKYADESHLFWSKGEQAVLEAGGDLHRECRNDPTAAIWEHAKLNGVDFRAVGNEPGWHMEIREGASILLVTDYGQTRLRFTNPRRVTERHAALTRYQASSNGHGIEVILKGATCQDSMADETYPTRVSIELDGTELRGCGRPLH